jgi:DNA-binding response OmpR family regulator
MNDRVASILVVDDDVDTCRNLQDILSDMGYQVDIAHDGYQALEKVKLKPYDIALLDLKMPGMDGITLYREIRKVQASAVALVVTAFASGSSVEQALSAGAWRVLSKPVDLGHLLDLVQAAVSQPLVMVVDDDHDLCNTLWDLLRDQGFRVGLAHDDAEAARQLAGLKYRVVLIDMRLPTADGSQVFHMVREIDPEARTVVITGHREEMDSLVQQVVAEGADAICYKPFDVPQLLATLQKLARTGAFRSG